MRTFFVLLMLAAGAACQAQDARQYYDSLDKALEKVRLRFTNDSSLSYQTSGTFGSDTAPKGLIYYSDTLPGKEDHMHALVLVPACEGDQPACWKFNTVLLPDTFRWGADHGRMTIVGTLFGNTDADKDNELIMIYSQQFHPTYPAYNPGCRDVRLVKVFDQVKEGFVYDASATKKIMDALGDTSQKCNATGKHKITDNYIKKKLQELTF